MGVVLSIYLQDMLSGAIDTTPTTIGWALSELMKHPCVMEKAQRELETAVGPDKMVWWTSRT